MLWSWPVSHLTEPTWLALLTSRSNLHELFLFEVIRFWSSAGLFTKSDLAVQVCTRLSRSLLKLSNIQGRETLSSNKAVADPMPDNSQRTR